MEDRTIMDHPLKLEESSYYAEAFSRNIGILTQEEQEKLRHATVAVAGLGGVGGIFALSLARLGIGGFNLADPDSFAAVNVNRQAGAMVSTFEKSKAEAMAAMIRDINPFARVRTFSEVDESAVGAFLNGATIVIDGIDFFTIEGRRLLYRMARERGLVVASAGPIGFGSSLQVFDPKGMSFDEYYDLRDGMTEYEMLLRFGLGIAPALLQRSYFNPIKISASNRAAPSIVSGTLLAANLVTTEVVKILLGRGEVDYMPHSSAFDPYVKKYKKVYLRRGNRSLSQRFKIWFVRRMRARYSS